MAYTILSAEYANPDHTAAVIMTKEAAAVLISSVDTPDEWAAMLKWGKPSAYVEPEPVEPPLKAEWDSASTQTAKLAVLAKALGLAD